jgi:hypothetical protein
MGPFRDDEKLPADADGWGRLQRDYPSWTLTKGGYPSVSGAGKVEYLAEHPDGTRLRSHSIPGLRRELERKDIGT